jgi:hypothetical protein
MPPTLPTYRQLASRSVAAAKEKHEWAGFPMPIEGQRLVIADGYPYKDGLERFQFGTTLHVDTTETVNECPDCEINRFYSCYKGTDVVVIRQANGRTTYGLNTHNRAKMLLDTIGASFAWPMEAELKATEKLEELIGRDRLTVYLLTGCFLETSKRSGVIYMFRKSRPTIAISQSDGELKILCALCLHPVGYYQGTWAGTMTPTDDVVAHLILMRGDEHKYWAHSSQHPAYRHEAGL